MKPTRCLPPTLLLLLTQTAAHMQLSYPPPLRSKFSAETPSPLIDYNMVAPLLADGSDYPCKNYQHDTAAHSTTTYTAGSSYNMSVVGGATHEGGSCQLALSYDNGATFKVIKSMIGGCPMTTTYDFTIPSFAPKGEALFAWTWFNKVGNREMYMNCAAVTIDSSSSSPPSRIRRGMMKRSTATSMNTLPQLFKANIGDKSSCTTIGGEELVFPDPGPDVQYGSGVTSSDKFDAAVCGGTTSQSSETAKGTDYEDATMMAMSATTTSSGPSLNQTTTSVVSSSQGAAKDLGMTTTSSSSASTSVLEAVPTTLRTSVRISPETSQTADPPALSPSAAATSTEAPPPPSAAESPSQSSLSSPSLDAPTPTSTPPPPPSSELTNTPPTSSSPLPPPSQSSRPSSPLPPPSPSQSPPPPNTLSTTTLCTPSTLHCLDPHTLSLCSPTGETYLPLSATAPGTICISSPSGDRIARENSQSFSSSSSSSSEFPSKSFLFSDDSPYDGDDGDDGEDGENGGEGDGECTPEGGLKCGDDGESFFMCAQGGEVGMGRVGEGMRCVEGSVVGA